MNICIRLYIATCVALVAATAPAAFASAPACSGEELPDADHLVACVRGPALWKHLEAFQAIADAHPDKQGHGNRDTGTEGYRASVDYVAGLMQKAGYQVTVQRYDYQATEVVGSPRLSIGGVDLPWGTDWQVARLSAGGTVEALIEPVSASGTGCDVAEWARFTPGRVALLKRGNCSADTQVRHAADAGAAAAVLFDETDPAANGVRELRLTEPAPLPVAGWLSTGVAQGVLQRIAGGTATSMHLAVETRARSGQDYNLIADSPFGDPSHVVVVEAHLDSIYGAGILDNASGSATILEIALQMAGTPTRNQLRYIWFGGEELGLLGSKYYTRNLGDQDRRRMAFDIDADVTATPNFDYLIADPAKASDVDQFPPNVVPESRVGRQYFRDFFAAAGVPVRSAWFGNNGTDSNAFSRIGIPNTGILTQQNCCKQAWEVKLWGGFKGNYEGVVPGHNGGCVDMRQRWCDNLANNDPDVLELASKATAYVVHKLANHPFRE